MKSDNVNLFLFHEKKKFEQKLSIVLSHVAMELGLSVAYQVYAWLVRDFENPLRQSSSFFTWGPMNSRTCFHVLECLLFVHHKEWKTSYFFRLGSLSNLAWYGGLLTKWLGIFWKFVSFSFQQHNEIKESDKLLWRGASYTRWRIFSCGPLLLLIKLLWLLVRIMSFLYGA